MAAIEVDRRWLKRLLWTPNINIGVRNLEIATMTDLLDQLEYCQYQTSDGIHSLTNNVAFTELRRRANLDHGLKLIDIESLIEKLCQIDSFADTEDLNFPPFRLDSESAETEKMEQLLAWFDDFTDAWSKYIRCVIEERLGDEG